MYYKRTIEPFIKKISKSFPVILLTGARQVGKTTMLQNVFKDVSYITLDDPVIRTLAKTDPALFIQSYKPPIIIDEIQYAPEILPYIKMNVDKGIKGYYLTGSQHFHAMKSISESLAGRVAIINLMGLSSNEIYDLKSKPFLPTNKFSDYESDINTVYKRIWKGSYPKAILDKKTDWATFYNSYLKTYLQRDLKDFANINNEGLFLQFLRVLASRSSQLLNMSDISKDIGVAVNTIKNWIYILEGSDIIYLLKPYHNNRSNRLIKTPKIYFKDTGLAAYLAGWLTATTLQTGAFSGAILETYLVSEILKSYIHNGRIADLYFYRDKDGKEIDLLIVENNTCYPVEIKKSATPNKNDFKSFSALGELNIKVGKGAVLSFNPNIMPITKDVKNIPIWKI